MYFVLFVCSDGVGRTGAFICIYSQLERVKMEGVADIFQFIKDSRLQRKGLVRHQVRHFYYSYIHQFIANIFSCRITTFSVMR